MAPGQFHEGELMAYLHGEPNPALEEALARSSELREELKDFARAIGVLTNVMGELDRPDFQDLIDVALEQASPAQRLRVAAYVRNSERGRQEMAEIEQDIANESVDERPRWHLPIFIAAPLAAATGLRSGSTIESVGTAAQEEMFQVLDIQLQVTVHITPPMDGRWAIEGYLTQHFVPMTGITVALHQGPATLSTVESDSLGFFHMDNLPAGSYQLGIHLDAGIVQVESIHLQQ